MSDDIHALIQTFLQAQSVTPLFSAASAPPMPPEDYQKSGIIPFLREGDHMFFYVMKPTAARPGTPPPKWQLCKGTRMYKSPASGKWKDMRAGEKAENVEIETLATTALREGHEELGLLPESIEKLFDLGPYRFSSAHTGAEKHMWLFAAGLDDRNLFLPASHVAATTADRGWFTLDEFRVVGREDHLYILEDIHTKLIAA
jgi:8-oxo-dGTP pyrophosphatase MutT (NUDIX family)